MSWIDQGRQEHGWFGHGTAAGWEPSESELRARAFAIVNLAADAFGPPRDRVPFSIAGTVASLRTMAPILAPEAELDPDPFRRHFFGDAFDPVDAWTVQRAMRNIASADTHADLLAAAGELANTIGNYGPNAWANLLKSAESSLGARAKDSGAADETSKAARTEDRRQAAPTRTTDPNIQLAAAGDRRCQGIPGGCSSGGSFGSTGAYVVQGRTLCMDFALKQTGANDLPADERIRTLRPFELPGR